MLGGVGVWSVIRVFVQQKLRSVAILKCVGGSTRQILAVYVAQVALMGLTGSALGVVMAAGAVAWVRPAVAAATGLEAPVGLTGSAVAQGAGIGLLVALLFALVPLLDIRHVRPSLLLRPSEPAPARRDAVWFGAASGIGALLVALAAWQAGSWRVGAILAGGFTGVSLVLLGAGMLLVRAMRPLQRSRSLAVRYASRRVGRPGSQVRPVLLAVGIGVFLVLGVRLLQDDLLRAMAITMRPDSPDMFVIDVQPDQADGVRAFLRAAGTGREPALIPVLRARITAIRGKETTLDSYEDVRGAGTRARPRVRRDLPRRTWPRNERLVAGEFWPASPPAGAQVSVERGPRRARAAATGRRHPVRHPRPGDRGDGRQHPDGGLGRRARRRIHVRVPARRAGVGARRRSSRRSRGRRMPRARARFQRDLTARFPNVSVIDVARDPGRRRRGCSATSRWR